MRLRFRARLIKVFPITRHMDSAQLMMLPIVIAFMTLWMASGVVMIGRKAGLGYVAKPVPASFHKIIHPDY